ELSDNFVFIKSLPFVLGVGVVTGLVRSARRVEEARGGQVRRFSAWTIVGHWLITIGFVLALPTGVWQYLGGITDKHLPFPRYLYPIPGPLLYTASTLHVAAMGLILLKVLDHLRYTLPRWSLMRAMVTGWISEGALRRILIGPKVPGEATSDPAAAPVGALGS